MGFRSISLNENVKADLIVQYTSRTLGKEVRIAYDTIMDFMDSMESDDIDFSMLNDESIDVRAEFFNNKLNTKTFDTINNLLEHCKNITR